MCERESARAGLERAKAEGKTRAARQYAPGTTCGDDYAASVRRIDQRLSKALRAFPDKRDAHGEPAAAVDVRCEVAVEDAKRYVNG